MSAGFMYANQDIYRKDLRHIYSGLPPPDIRFRVRTYHSGIDHLTRLHEMQTKPRRPREPARSYEFWPQYDMAVPSAPAFKRMSNSDINGLVTRLHGNNRLDEKKILEQIEPKPGTKDPEVAERKRSVTPRMDIITAERIDVNALIQRLYYKGKTHTSTLRQREPVYRLTARPRSSFS